jgi:hypothetical protein
MRRISLIPYRIDGNQAYLVRESLTAVLFGVKLGPGDLIEHDRIARKIESAENNVVELTEREYDKLRWCVEVLPAGYSRNDLEFINRILNAEELPEEGGMKENV